MHFFFETFTLQSKKIFLNTLFYIFWIMLEDEHKTYQICRDFFYMVNRFRDRSLDLSKNVKKKKLKHILSNFDNAV